MLTLFAVRHPRVMTLPFSKPQPHYTLFRLALRLWSGKPETVVQVRLWSSSEELQSAACRLSPMRCTGFYCIIQDLPTILFQLHVLLPPDCFLICHNPSPRTLEYNMLGHHVTYIHPHDWVLAVYRLQICYSSTPHCCLITTITYRPPLTAFQVPLPPLIHCSHLPVT